MGTSAPIRHHDCRTSHMYPPRKEFQMIRVRNAQARDASDLLRLEQKVWRPRGISPITDEIFHRWLSTYPEGFFVALRNHSVCGYAYHERVQFQPRYPQSPAIQHLIRRGHAVSHHRPDGNTLFGVSIATYPRGSGIGKSLVRALLHSYAARNTTYLITLSRIPGLRRFLKQVGAGNSFTTLLHNHVHATVEQIRSGKTHITPAPRRPDPVLGWFISNLTMEVHTIVESSFRDPESCDHAVLLVRRLSPTV